MVELKNNEQLFSEYFDVQPQAIIWLKPIWDGPHQQIIDFEFAYCNEEGLKYLNITREQQTGLLFSKSPTVTDELRKKFFEEMLTVYETGVKSETNIYNPALNKYARVLRTKLHGGILTVVQDRTEENRIIKELEEKTELLREQTQFSDSVLDASLDIIIAVQAIRNNQGVIEDFSITKVNRKYKSLFNQPNDTLNGTTLLHSFPVLKSSGFFNQLCSVIESGQPIQDERHYADERLDNWFQYSIVKLATDSAVITVSDITDRKKAVEQIEHQKNLLDSILQHSPAGISVTEVIRDEAGNVVDGRTILANDSAVEYVGIPKELYLTKTVREIDPAIFDSPLYQLALTTLVSGKSFHTQYFFEPAKRWLELSVAKMDNDHLINVFVDVTNTKEAQIRQQKLLDELQRSNTDLEEFAYAASHDLKEPIRKVMFFSDRLKNRLQERMDEEDTRYFSRLEAANQRMGTLVDDLLTYSQVSQRPNTLQEVDLNALMQVILEDLELEIEEKSAKISLTNLATIKGHQRQLQQLFQNLIGNALKYSKPQTPPEIKVTCSTQLGKDTGLVLTPEEWDRTFYTIKVSDNGIGFNPSDAENIFKVFTRLHTNTEYRGTGVGLAIARKVAQNHGGYITADSVKDEGSTFSVYLPMV